MTDIPKLAQRTTPDYVKFIATALACLPILAIAQYAGVTRVDDIDAYLFAYYGRRIVAGQALYADLWDNKPPGIFWIDALGLWLTGKSYAGIVLVCSAATLGSAVMFFLTARRLYGVNTACIGTVIAALYINLYHYRVSSNRPSTFYVFFELCALFLYCRSFDPRLHAARQRFAAGLCVVAAMCFRQTALSVPAAIVLHQLFLSATRRQPWRAGARVLVSGLGGVAAALVVVIVVLWLTSDLAEAWHAVVASNLGYVTESRQSRVVPQVYGWREHERELALPAILAAAAVIYGIATAFISHRRRRNKADAGATDGEAERVAPSTAPPCVFALLVCWLPVAVYLALIGPHRALHYYGIALPPLCMMATHAVWLLTRGADRSGHPRIHVIVAVLWFAHMSLPVFTRQVHAAMAAHAQRFDERYVDRYGETVDALERHTDETDRVYTVRYLPAVFWRLDRPVAHRYILDTLIDQWDERSQPYVDTVIRDLKADPPKAIVATRRDLREMDEPPPECHVTYHDFATWVRNNYRLVNEGHGSDVWIRR